jgi:hypothetical protein
MVPWIKRWRDWAMNDLWPLFRSAAGPPQQALHYNFEKAGLTLENQPIPWNAEAVLVEASVKLPASAKRERGDFLLILADPAQVIPAEALRQEEADGHARLFFRFDVPPRGTSAELRYRGRPLGRLELPVLAQEDFLNQLNLQLPTVHVGLGEQTVVCQTFVNTQCQGLHASAVLASPTSLAPVADLNLRVELCREEGDLVVTVPIHLSSSQLRSRQALITASLPRPRRIGACLIRWMLGDRALAAHKIRGISKKQFLRSLRISSTRFALHRESGEISIVRSLPTRDGALALEGITRLSPCFLVTSGETGMAGLATLQVRAQVAGAIQAPLIQEQELLITDGPIFFLPGTLEGMLDASDVLKVQHFSLESPEGRLGLLPLSPAPTAHFNSEGGFEPADEFVWSSAAEEQLNEKLGKLLGGM